MPNSLAKVDGLSPNQHRAAEMLAEGARAKDVIDMVGVSYQTLSNWYKQPEFVAKFEKRVREQSELSKNMAARARLRSLGLVDKAYDVLEDLLDSEDENIKIRAVALVQKGQGIGQPDSQTEKVASGAVLVITTDEIEAAKQWQEMRRNAIEAEVIEDGEKEIPQN